MPGYLWVIYKNILTLLIQSIQSFIKIEILVYSFSNFTFLSIVYMSVVINCSYYITGNLLTVLTEREKKTVQRKATSKTVLTNSIISILYRDDLSESVL